MTLRHMKIFCSVCENNSNLTKAAESLNMTQPAVSLAIKELEQYYGVILFDRIGKRLHLTEAGREFLEYANHISSLFSGMETMLRNWDSFGIIRVGASITIGSQLLPDYVRTFSSIHPNIEVKVNVAPSDILETKILAGELDVALVEGIIHSKSIISEEYMQDHLCVICAAGGRYKNGECISIDEFRKEKILLREKGSGTREVFDLVTGNAGFVVEPSWEAMSTAALINAVVNGLGLAVLPYRMILGPLGQGLINIIKVEKLDFTRTLHIIYHKDKLLSSAAREFLDICRSYESDYPIPKYSHIY